MKKVISLMTLVVAITFGPGFANKLMAASLDRDNFKNGITYFSTGPASFDNFDISPAGPVEETSSCLGGSSAGGLTAGVPGRRNGITHFSTGPASFDAGPTGPDTGGSCVNTAPRKVKNAGWPEDFS